MTSSSPPVLPDEHLEAGVVTKDRLDAIAHIQGTPGVIVITMGCGDAGPVVPGRRYLDWPTTDPEGAPINVVRGIRDEIDAHITELLDSLPSA